VAFELPSLLSLPAQPPAATPKKITGSAIRIAVFRIALLCWSA
jgi:hypothetical protein